MRKNASGVIALLEFAFMGISGTFSFIIVGTIDAITSELLELEHTQWLEPMIDRVNLILDSIR